MLLEYSRIRWPAPPSARDLAWEDELARIVELSVALEEQRKVVTKVTAQLTDVRYTHFQESTREENLFLELEERKEKLKMFSFN